MDADEGATDQPGEASDGPKRREGDAAALAAYKRFIDLFVAVARNSVTAKRIRDNWPYAEPQNHPDLRRFNDLLASLTPEQRARVTELVEGERMGAVGDLLAQMTWKDLRIIDQGIELAWEPFGSVNYYDYTCRCEGDRWPDERADGSSGECIGEDA